MIFLLIFVVLVTAELGGAQPDSLWSRTYGDSTEDFCTKVLESNEGGYVLTGYTGFYGQSRYGFRIVRTDDNGHQSWTRGYEFGSLSICVSAVATIDGGYLLAGNSTPYEPNFDFRILALNSIGDSLWSRHYGGLSDDHCWDIAPTSDGGYVLAGQTTSFGPENENFWIVKVSFAGDSLWSLWLGGSGRDVCRCVQQTADGGYVLAGQTQSYGAGSDDVWLVKLGPDGNVAWSHHYGGPLSDICSSCLETSDGGYILAGRTQSFGAGDYDFWLLKTNSFGDSMWSRTFGGDGLDICWSVIEVPSGGYVLGGTTQSFGAGNRDFWVIRTTQTGDSLWSRTFGGAADDACTSLQRTIDGSYAIAGYTNSRGAGDYDFLLVKTSSDLAAAKPTENFPASFELSCSPNPFNPSTTIEFQLPKSSHIALNVYDLLGRKVFVLKDGLVVAGTHSFLFDGSSLASGVYLTRLDAGMFTTTRKLVLLK